MSRVVSLASSFFASTSVILALLGFSLLGDTAFAGEAAHRLHRHYGYM